MKPFEIVEIHPRLYLANKVWIDRDLPMLRERGIEAIVNLVEDHDYKPPRSIAYVHAPFVDGTFIDPLVLETIYAFIAKHIRRSNVLIHCAAGISRSTGIVLGQLLLENPRWTWAQALASVKRKRSVWVALEIKESVLGYLAWRAEQETSRRPAESRIPRRERDVLRHIEEITGTELREVPAINWNTKGYTTRRNRVVGVGLYDTKLTDFPEPVVHLSELREIKMYFNRLRSLPHGIDRLDRLCALGLYANELGVLPDGIGRLRSLTTLNLAQNRLVRLPRTLGRLGRLKELYLQNNCLTAIPPGIGELYQLRDLYLQKNRLTVLPKKLACLSKLAYFSAESNAITAIPEGLCRLSSLRSLNLANNRIQALPEGRWQLPKLENLNVSLNSLESLPAGLAASSSIRRLNIAWNRLAHPSEVIRDWLTSLEKKGCVIVGGDRSDQAQHYESGV